MSWRSIPYTPDTQKETIPHGPELLIDLTYLVLDSTEIIQSNIDFGTTALYNSKTSRFDYNFYKGFVEFTERRIIIIHV